MFIRRLCLCICILLFVSAAQAATINNVRIWRAEGYTRVVLDLDDPVNYNLVLASNPTRIILDLANSTLNTSVAKLPLKGTPIEIVRSSVVDDKDIRLVFDLKHNVAPKSFLLKKSDGNHDRLVLDLYNIETTSVPSVAATVPKPSAAPGVPKTDADSKKNVTASSEPTNIEELLANEVPAEPIVKTPQGGATSERQILIAVDAGHGGADSGALGPKNMREKDVTLSIAKELVRVINAQPGYSARLTRKGDYFVELQKRRDLARDMKADLFISVHADSFTDSSAYGASVFALSRKGATSEMARFLAQRENDSDLVGRIGGVSLEDKDAQLAGVLVDLSMTATVNSSLQVGSHVLNAISGIAPLHAKHVEQAGFAVLKSPDVPSILVETGFISNTSESRKLASPAYREQMAEAIFKGVHRYFTQHPLASVVATPYIPAETNQSVAAEKAAGRKPAANSSQERRYTVVRGDTLSDIATRHRVSASQIRKLNNMKDSTVKLGQTLKIPAQ
ncbi:MAG: AMIN domain-containing protein [Gammaproteobacteria bacterium]|nr:MAG: AMIN domain-containing protein [Gammaproteobacteria bacterium]